VTQLDLTGLNCVVDAHLAILARVAVNLQHLSLRRIVDIGPRISDLGLKLLAGRLGGDRDINALTYHGGLDAGGRYAKHHRADVTDVSLSDGCGRFLPQLQGCKYLVGQAALPPALPVWLILRNRSASASRGAAQSQTKAAFLCLRLAPGSR
jgi:hypothetical protein